MRVRIRICLKREKENGKSKSNESVAEQIPNPKPKLPKHKTLTIKNAATVCSTANPTGATSFPDVLLKWLHRHRSCCCVNRPLLLLACTPPVIAAARSIRHPLLNQVSWNWKLQPLVYKNYTLLVSSLQALFQCLKIWIKIWDPLQYLVF